MLRADKACAIEIERSGLVDVVRMIGMGHVEIKISLGGKVHSHDNLSCLSDPACAEADLQIQNSRDLVLHGLHIEQLLPANVLTDVCLEGADEDVADHARLLFSPGLGLVVHLVVGKQHLGHTRGLGIVCAPACVEAAKLFHLPGSQFKVEDIEITGNS